MIRALRHPIADLAALAGLLLLASPVVVAAPPADGWIAWSSNRADSRHEIYLMRGGGGDITRITHEGGTHAMWSPDGRWIAYRALNDQAVYIVRWNGAERQQICTGEPYFWMHDNSGLVCGYNGYVLRVNPETKEQTPLFRMTDFPMLAGAFWFDPGGITHDGRWLLAHTDRFQQGFTATNGTFRAMHAAVVLDLQRPDQLFFFGAGCEPTTTPSGDLIYHVCGTDGTCASPPDIYRMNVNDVANRASYQPEIQRVDGDWGHTYMPRISTDGKWMTYAATQGCHDLGVCDYEIFLHELNTSGSPATADQRLTRDPGNDQWPHMYVGPRWGEGARISLSPTWLRFAAAKGDRPVIPPPQVVQVLNDGTGPLSALTVTNAPDWLAVDVNSTANTLAVAVKATALIPGQYQASFEVAAAGAAPQRCTVTLTVGGPPEASTGCGLSGSGPRTSAALALLAGLLAVLALVRRRGH
jgi:hypothetical protein